MAGIGPKGCASFAGDLMLTLYSMPSSGNSYKVRLLLAKVGPAFRHVSAENGSGVTSDPRFLALNPKGKVPLLLLEDGRSLLLLGLISYTL